MKRKREQLTNTECMKADFLTGVQAHIVPAGISKVRCDLFTRQLIAKGGSVCADYNSDHVTHVIVDENIEIDRLCRIMKWEGPPSPDECKIVKSLWLSHCLRDKRLLDTTMYELDLGMCKNVKSVNPNCHTEKSEASSSASCTKPSTKVNNSQLVTSVKNQDTRDIKSSDTDPGIRHHIHKKVINSDYNTDPDSDYMLSAEEDNDDSGESDGKQQTTSSGKPLPKGNWVCARSSMAPTVNHNKHITDKLEALAKTYQNTNDKWRAFGYSRAISILKSHPKPISTYEEALALPGIGKRLAEKIWEIVESGELRKLDELTSSEDVKAINLFTNIWGVGATTARSWVAQNLRTLDDVRKKAKLTRVQKIGLKYYDELLDRMPRSEAAEIELVIKEATQSIDPDLICMACGSYRRGKPTCGDVDVLVTHPDGKSHKGVFHQLLTKLRQSGFLTDDLISQEENGNQKKYLGICRLPGEGRLHRRLDIIIVPYDEFACASMYFTGSAHFNRSMRNLASKMGMSLNEHGLYAGVIRQNNEKITKGYPLNTPDEESIFRHLGLTYRPPSERDH